MMIGIIPTRKGTKRLPGKTHLEINGKSLLQYALDSANTEMLNSVIVDTNDPKVIDYCMDKANVSLRPEHLAQDKTHIIDTLRNTIIKYESSICDDIEDVCLLQVTSPQRTINHVETAIKLYKDNKCSSLYSGYWMDLKTKEKSHTKYTADKHFQRNGAIFIFKKQLLYYSTGKLWDDNVYEFAMSEYDSVDINTEKDYNHVKKLMGGCE